MSEAVTDVIVSRSRQAEGLTSMVAWSVALHVAFAGLAMTLPEAQPEPLRTVMTISLGGGPGPESEGLTQAGGRAVQAPAPAEPVRPVETLPAPTPPPMTLPTPPQARPRPPQPKPEQAPPQATGKTPSTGEQPREGSTPAETGARGQGFGLSTGGGGLGGVTVDAEFCCPEYLQDMVRRIRENWQQNQGLTGSTWMQYTIARDGAIQAIQVVSPSGFFVLDEASQRALQRTQRLPPLPAAFTNPTLTVRVRFDYQR